MASFALNKLKSIAEFLKNSSVFNFVNYEIDLFVNFIENNKELSAIMNDLLSRFPKSSVGAEKLSCQVDGIKINLSEIRGSIDSFDGYVAYCYSYLKQGIEGHSVLMFFYGNKHPDGCRNDTIATKGQFFIDCIMPIVVYFEMQIEYEANALHILQRYKVLCEWYEREQLIGMGEVDITQKHLSKYLFDQGFTYSLSETVVPSGRIDNFALSLGLKDAKGLKTLPDALIAEGKIYNGSAKSNVVKVKNQALKRAMELNFGEAYCVVFNKSEKKLVIEGADFLNGVYCVREDNKRIFIFIVNLSACFYDSTSTISDVIVNLAVESVEP